MRLICVLSVILFGGCAASSTSSGTTTPAPAPTTTAEPAALPGTYQEGLGNPYIQISNQMDRDLSIQVTDATGYAYSAYVYPGTTYDLTINPGVFSYYATAGDYSDSGSYTVEYDNSYTWSWTLNNDASAGYGSGGYTWSSQGQSDYMTACTAQGTSWDYCNCTMLQVEASFSEEMLSSRGMTATEVDAVIDACAGPGDHYPDPSEDGDGDGYFYENESGY